MRLRRTPCNRRDAVALTRFFSLPLLLGLLLATAPAYADDMAAQRAQYALTLSSARGDITAASGTMAYEVQDACDGWATRQRLDMTITNRDGQDVEMVSDYATWESKDGLKMRFRMRQTTEAAVTSELAGEATLQPNGGPGVVKYSLPEGQTKELPKGTLFPTAHTATIIAAAEAGKKFIALPLFDGTGADGAQDSSVAITSWSKPAPNKWPDLSKLPSSTVHVAFFDRTPASQEPTYEVGMRYWSNGVADDLSMDFGSFVMAGKMTELQLLPSHC
jgi:hypothetical protein